MIHTQTTCPNHVALRAGKKGRRPAEVGTLALVFEISATELKLKHRLLKCKRTIQRATFNFWIGQLLELTASVIDHNIDIKCIQELRYIHSEDIKYHNTGNWWTFVSASARKNSVNATIGGVDMLIGPRARKSQYSIEKIQPRMMVAIFNGNPSATIISCYVFVAASYQTRLDTRSKARRPFKVGIKWRRSSGTSRDSNPACVCCSSAHLVQWGKQFHEPKCESGHVCQFTA